jgi:peptide deformylase
MSRLKVETGTDNPILRKKAKPVRKIDRQLLKLLKDMEETMEVENGCGLAAPQIGQDIRVIMVKLNQSTDQELNIPMINPEIIFHSEETYIDSEGCLSLPKYFDDVERSMDIIVKYQNEKGKEQMLKLTELNARVVQHEVDHLEGILFSDKTVDGVPEKLLAPNKNERQLNL